MLRQQIPSSEHSVCVWVCHLPLIQMPCGLTPPPCQGITHLGHERQWYHCVLYRLVKAQREVLAGEVRLTSAVLLRLCGQICVVCVPHCIVVFFVLVQTSQTTGRFYTQVFVYVLLLRAAVCGMAYTRECVKPGHACFALYFLSLEELARKGYYTQFVRSCDFLCFISRSVKA